MGFWDDDDKKDFSAFGIMANSGFPTPDAFLVKEVADQNTTYNNPMQNPYGFGNSASTYTPSYTPTSYDDDDRDYSYTPSRSQQTYTPDPKAQIRLELGRVEREYTQLGIKLRSLEYKIEKKKANPPKPHAFVAPKDTLAYYEKEKAEVVKQLRVVMLKMVELKKQLY